MKALHQLTVVETLKGLKERKFTSLELVEHYLERIAKYNSELNAYLVVNEKARQQAMEASHLRLNRSADNPVKDNPPVRSEALIDRRI